MIPFSPRKCRICNRALTVHQAVAQVCDRPECRAAAVRAAAEKRSAERREEMRLIAAHWLKESRDARDFTREYSLLVLQGYEPTLEPTPEYKRVAMREHMESLLAEPNGESLDNDTGSESTADAPPRPGMAAACIACRGHCCRAGGSRAFMDAKSMSRIRRAHANADDLIDAYVAAVPELHIADGCVFQGERGCTLPRDLRSDTCNEFYCQPLRNWIVSAPEMKPGPTAVAVVYDGEVVRSAIIDDIDAPLTSWRPPSPDTR